MAETKEHVGFFARMGRFFKDIKAETKKVVWPNRKQVINNTGIVLAAIAIIGSVIWILDFCFRTLVGFVL